MLEVLHVLWNVMWYLLLGGSPLIGLALFTLALR